MVQYIDDVKGHEGHIPFSSVLLSNLVSFNNVAL